MKIEFICDDPTIAEHFPPVPAVQCIPDWYKKLNFYLEGHRPTGKELMEAGVPKPSMSIRACVPVKDYLTSGYVIRAHADIAITPEQVGDEHGWWYASAHTKIDSHPHAQCPISMGKGKNAYIKIVTPWRVKTPKGYSCMYYQPYYLLEDKFQLFPAVVDTDGYNTNPVNFPGVILTAESFTIKAGSPLMVVVPFKRDAWRHTVRVEPEAKINPVQLFLERGYKTLFNRKKVFK